MTATLTSHDDAVKDAQRDLQDVLDILDRVTSTVKALDPEKGEGANDVVSLIRSVNEARYVLEGCEASLWHADRNNEPIFYVRWPA